MPTKKLILFSGEIFLELKISIKELLVEEKRIFQETGRVVQVFSKGEIPENTSELNMSLYEKIKGMIEVIKKMIIPEKKLIKLIVFLEGIQQLLATEEITTKENVFCKFSDIFILEIDNLIFTLQKQSGI